MEELSEAIARPKFDRYVTPGERVAFFQHLARIAIHVQILQEIRACRDPRDDNFLAVAVNGEA